MIGKIIRGAGFRGSMDYLFHEGKGAEIVASNMVGTTARSLAKEFAPVRQSNQRAKKPVLHIILAQPPGERLATNLWEKIVQSMLLKVGLSEDRPWVAVRHNDCTHDHVHVITSRVDYRGNIWLGHWQVKALLKAKAEVEREYGLTVTPIGNASIRFGDGHIRRIRRELATGCDPVLPPQPELSIIIDNAIVLSDGGVEAFERALVSGGAAVKYNRSQKTGRVAGASFQLQNGEWLKGSQIGKQYSWKRIVERLAAIQVAKKELPKNTIENEHVVLSSGVQQSPGTGIRNEDHARDIEKPRTHVGVGPAQQNAIPAAGEPGGGTHEVDGFPVGSRKELRNTDVETDTNSPRLCGTVEEDGSGGYWEFEHLRLFRDVLVRLTRYIIQRATKVGHIPKPSNYDQHRPIRLAKVTYAGDQNRRKRISI